MSEEMLTWLRAQLDARLVEVNEDEIHNRYCSHIEHRHDDDWTPIPPCDCGEPELARTEVESKRRILDSYVPPGADPHPGQPCTNNIESDPKGLAYDEYESCERHLRAAKRQLRSDHVLRLMTIPYRDRAGYDPSWAPESSEPREG